jgi:class 3 adenylate cyclase
MTIERRLAAILVADVVGFSKLIDSGEAGTPANRSARRRDVVEPTLASHSGRLLSDGFPSRIHECCKRLLALSLSGKLDLPCCCASASNSAT